MHRRVRAFAVCHLQSGTGHVVLYSMQEDMYYVEMQCTNSYGYNKEPCWPALYYDLLLSKHEEKTHLK